MFSSSYYIIYLFQACIDPNKEVEKEEMIEDFKEDDPLEVHELQTKSEENQEDQQMGLKEEDEFETCSIETEIDICDDMNGSVTDSVSSDLLQFFS